jgi:hypothetical protein
MTLFVFIVYAGNKILFSLLYRGDVDKFLLEKESYYLFKSSNLCRCLEQSQ